MTLYEELMSAGIPIDHHGSDLYFRATAESGRILDKHRHRYARPSTFKSQVDGELWFDVPFAYDPFWLHNPDN